VLRGQLFGSASSLFFYALVMRQIAGFEHARARRPAVAAARRAKSAGIGNGFDAGTAARAARSDLPAPSLPAGGPRSQSYRTIESEPSERHPDEGRALARPSRWVATGAISPVAGLRNARKSAPQHEADGRYRYDSNHGYEIPGRAGVIIVS